MDWNWLWVAAECGLTYLFHRLWKDKDSFIAVLEVSPDIDISDLKKFSSTTNSIDFATVHGNVQPLDSSANSVFKSRFLQNCVGVIYQWTITERKIERDRQEWSQKERLINDSIQHAAFRLVGTDGSSIRIDKPLDFNQIKDQLEVVYVNFEASQSSAAQKLIGVLTGNVTTGIETKERMLLPNVALTGIGRLERQGRVWRLIPHGRWGGILTRSTRAEVLQEARNGAGWLRTFRNIFIVITGVTVFYLLYRYHQQYQERQRRNRPNSPPRPIPRATVEQNDANDTNVRLQCIICLQNEITTTLQPCSHLGLCDQCVERMRNRPSTEQKCPLCRTPIETYQRVFLP